MPIIKEMEGIEKKGAICAEDGCGERAISLSDFCWNHIPDKERYKEEMATRDFSSANLVQADLSSVNLFDTNLSNADLVGANLSGSDLTGVNLSGADLTKADLSNARLWHADLSNAKLVEADLTSADLWQAKMIGARLWRADISKAKSLSKNNFQCEKEKFFNKCQVYEDGYIAAEETYRNLKRYFINEGRYNDASWASFKEKTMEKNRLKKARDLSFIPIAIMGLLCGYGEKPYRIILSSFFIIFTYAILFYLLKSITTAAPNNFLLNFGDYVYYSVVTFTTLGYGDIIPKTSTLYRLLAVSEAFLGAFLMGLFIFTLARKYSAR